MPPLVSVIVPAYNAERWLADCLRSVHAQTYPYIETIVVDDGSTDGTRDVAADFLGPHMRLVSQANSGAGSARNAGIALAQGDYFQFLDADDVISPNKIGAAVALLDRLSDPDAFAVSRFRRFRSSLEDMPFVQEESFRDLDGVQCMIQMTTWTFGGTQPSGSWLVPRILLERALPWPTHPCAFDDAAILFRLLGACSMMRFEPEGIHYYRNTGTASVRTLRHRAAITGAFITTQIMVDAMLARENSDRTRYAAACSFQKFVYEHYLGANRDLIAKAEALVREYGGAAGWEPDGSPAFHALRHVVGWKLARHAERVHRAFRSAQRARPRHEI